MNFFKSLTKEVKIEVHHEKIEKPDPEIKFDEETTKDGDCEVTLYYGYHEGYMFPDLTVGKYILRGIYKGDNPRAKRIQYHPSTFDTPEEAREKIPGVIAELKKFADLDFSGKCFNCKWWVRRADILGGYVGDCAHLPRTEKKTGASFCSLFVERE